MEDPPPPTSNPGDPFFPPFPPLLQAGLQTLQALGPEMRRALSCDLGENGGAGAEEEEEEEEQLTYAVSPAPNRPRPHGHAHPVATPIQEAPPLSQAPEALYGSAPDSPGRGDVPKAPPSPSEGEEPAAPPHGVTQRHGGRYGWGGVIGGGRSRYWGPQWRKKGMGGGEESRWRSPMGKEMEGSSTLG